MLTKIIPKVLYLFHKKHKMKKILTILSVVMLVSCAEMQQVLQQLPQTQSMGLDISGGLKEALNNGISKQVTKLTAVDGFYKNEAVKILLPEELKKIDSALRNIGMSKLADDGLKAINRTAEDAVKEATPIFVNAITGMTFSDAKNILLGNESAATNYLQSATTSALYGKFNPVIKNSFAKVGADKIWTNIITKYNSIPLVTKVNPDLTDYVTNQAMNGVFKMIAVEEKNIRVDLNSRTSDLLKQVFALQDRN
jgi:Protein of unknown function (DUF4197)